MTARIEAEWIEIDKKLLYHRACYHTPSQIAQAAYFHILGAGHFGCHPEFHLKRKKYACYLVKYTRSGSGTLIYRGKTYTLKPHQLFILDCRDYQEYYTSGSEPWENMWVHFDGGMSEKYFNLIYQNHGPVIDLPEDSVIPRLLQEMLALMENEDSRFEIKASPLILQLLTEIMLASTTQAQSSAGPQRNEAIDIALGFIEANYTKPITIDDVAKAAQVSLYHFTRSFKKIIGFTPYEYVIKYRMNKAKALLSRTRLSVEEIAIRVGFQDAGAFIRAFKKLENTTPLQYRKLIV